MASESFKKVFLDAHNTYRAKHGAPALSYNSELCGVAQKWAENLLSRDTLEHAETPDGENLYFSGGTAPPKGNEAVDAWYGEIKDYHFQNPGFSGQTGHFTQVVWKDSKELGVGMATNGSKVFVVGRYRPAGNMNITEYFVKNVLPSA